jgi:hypothetical protein
MILIHIDIVSYTVTAVTDGRKVTTPICTLRHATALRAAERSLHLVPVGFRLTASDERRMTSTSRLLKKSPPFGDEG